jgi:hypothetical protein
MNALQKEDEVSLDYNPIVEGNGLAYPHHKQVDAS